MRLHGWIGAAALALAAGGAAAGEADRVLATVNGAEITLGHVASLRDNLPAQYQAIPDAVLFKAILDQLIQQTVLAQAVEGALDARAMAGLANVRRDYLARVAMEGTSRAAVTEAAVAEAYARKYTEGEPKTEWNAAHILVATEEEAQRIKAEIEGGGALGWFGLGMMVPEFEAAVVALEPGQIGGPVQTQFGWHLVKLNERRLAAAPPLDAVRAELATEIERAAIDARIAALLAAATVVRSDDGVDPALMRDQSLFD